MMTRNIIFYRFLMKKKRAIKIIKNKLRLHKHQWCHLCFYLFFLVEVQVVVANQVHQEGWELPWWFTWDNYSYWRWYNNILSPYYIWSYSVWKSNTRCKIENFYGWGVTSIENNDTWKLVPRPSGKKPIGFKWIYKEKNNAKKKSWEIQCKVSGKRL
jgi:hypothetical protein